MNIAIIGMGALGLLFADELRKDPSASVAFIADAARRARYASEPVSINGVPARFDFADPGAASPADLLIFAVKATALDSAIEAAASFVGPHTILLSLLNGITSERILAERFGDQNLVWCVAQGMDAVREGRALRYSKPGELRVGLPGGGRSPALDALIDQFDRSGVPYTLEADILRRLWSKFMLNVGVNQVVMVCEGAYGTVQRPGAPRDRMIAAMREVQALAALEGVTLTDADLTGYLALIDTLAPDGMPSMRQDGLARRKSEVELFSGTVLTLAAPHNLSVPVNEALYREVRRMEEEY